MKFYEIYNEDLGINVKYKLLSPSDALAMREALNGLEKKDYIQEVLARIIYNAYTDIMPILKDSQANHSMHIINNLYMGSVMLNPALDVDAWNNASKTAVFELPEDEFRTQSLDELLEGDDDYICPGVIKKIPRNRIINLESILKNKIIGQDEAIDAIARSVKRHEAGLTDKKGPIGVFLLVGPSGTGKTYLAKEIQRYLYDANESIVRIDCGEYQQKHDSHKLIGSPPGYLGHDNGGQLTNRVINNPNCVILLDEIEKAHPDVCDMFLRVFEDGNLTDSKGREVDFSNTIMIMTTNLGNSETTAHLTGRQTGFGARVDSSLSSTEILSKDIITRYANEAIKKFFRPEFLNRIHKTIIFNPLGEKELQVIADQTFQDLDKKLSKKGYVLQYSQDVTNKLARDGSDTVSNARGILKHRKDYIDDQFVDIILNDKPPRGTVFSIVINNDEFVVTANKAKREVNK